MPLSHQDLIALHAKVTEQLIQKLTKVPPRMWLANCKPTIKDIYNDTEYVHSYCVPDEYQIWYIFEHFEQFVAQDFQVRKREGDINVNMAIWYWQMDVHHSFSSVHWTSRYNIIMAYVVAASGLLDTFEDESLQTFITALHDAFHESVTKQMCSKDKQRFLSIWAAGEHDYIYWGKKGRTEMYLAIQALEQAAPVQPFDRESNMDNFWNRLQCEKPRDKRNYGARWAVHYVMYLEHKGKVIEQKDEYDEVEWELTNDLLVKKFASASLEAGEAAAAEEVFASPRIQALLSDPPEATKRPNNTKKEEMWMSPDDALAILREDEAVQKAMLEEEERKVQKAMQDMEALSTSSYVLGQ